MCFWIFCRVRKSIMTMRTSTLSHMSWSTTTEEQRLVKMIFHKRPPNLCCWLWIYIHIYLCLFFSDWEADPVRHSGSGRDRWPLRRCRRPLGRYKIGWFLKHRPYADWWTALMCEYIKHRYLHIHNVSNSQVRGTHSFLSECRVITRWRGTKSCIFILKDWDKWQSWTRWDSEPSAVNVKHS